MTEHIHLHHHFHFDEAGHFFETIIRKVTHMSQQLDDLTTQVSANTSVIESALTLIQGLRQQIIDAGTDPAKLQALTDSLKAEDDKLAAAIADNTPASP